MECQKSKLIICISELYSRLDIRYFISVCLCFHKNFQVLNQIRFGNGYLIATLTLREKIIFHLHRTRIKFFCSSGRLLAKRLEISEILIFSNVVFKTELHCKSWVKHLSFGTDCGVFGKRLTTYKWKVFCALFRKSVFKFVFSYEKPIFFFIAGRAPLRAPHLKRNDLKSYLAGSTAR